MTPRKGLGQDAVAGLCDAISSVPDGMASAVLVGVNPVHGLYASLAGPVAGGLTSSTRMLVITITTAAAHPDMAALMARTVPVTLAPPDRAFGATPVLGESTWAALHEAQAWVVDRA